MAKTPVAKISVIGGSFAGKTSLVSALTGMNYNELIIKQVQPMLVRVQDPRLNILYDICKPKGEIVYPLVEITDTPSIDLSGKEIDQNRKIFASIKECDILFIVLGVYNRSVNSLTDAVKTEREKIMNLLIMADLDMMQRRVEKLNEQLKKLTKTKEQDENEKRVLEQLIQRVLDGIPNPYIDLSDEDLKRLRGFQFFTAKPIQDIANIKEGDYSQRPELNEVESLSISLELELLNLGQNELNLWKHTD